MVDTGLSLMPTLADLGIKVYDPVQTQKENDEECKDLADVLKSVNRLLESLTQITHDKEQILEQGLQSLKEHLETCKKFIDKHGKKWILTKTAFHQSEQDELKNLNRKLTQCLQRLHIAMDARLGKYYLEHFEKLRSNENIDRVLLVEIRRNQLKVSPSDKTMLD